MKAIVDILKENNLYTFMAIKEELLIKIEECLQETEYASKYALGGSFTSTDQTISIVVGVLAEKTLRSFLAGGVGSFLALSTPMFREYTYGINVTGINDDEVKSIAKYIYYHIIKNIPDINLTVRARIHSDLYVQAIKSLNIGEKRMWSINIYATAAINEVYYPRIWAKFGLINDDFDDGTGDGTDGGTEDGTGGGDDSGGLDADGYIPPDFYSCVELPGEGSKQVEPVTTEPATTEPATTEPPVPDPPIALGAIDVSHARFTAVWEPVAEASYYRLDVAGDELFESYVVGMEDRIVSGTTQLVTGLGAEHVYYYRVRAVNDHGVSENSNVTSVETREEPAITMHGGDQDSVAKLVLTFVGSGTIDCWGGVLISKYIDNEYGTTLDITEGDVDIYIIRTNPSLETYLYFNGVAITKWGREDGIVAWKDGYSNTTELEIPDISVNGNGVSTSISLLHQESLGAGVNLLFTFTSCPNHIHLVSNRLNTVGWVYYSALNESLDYLYVESDRVDIGNAVLPQLSGALNVLRLENWMPAPMSAEYLSEILTSLSVQGNSIPLTITIMQYDETKYTFLFIQSEDPVQGGTITEQIRYYVDYLLTSMGVTWVRVTERGYFIAAPGILDASEITSDSFVARWNKPEDMGAAEYYLDVAIDADFKTYVPGYESKNVGDVGSSTVEGLSAETNYFYRVHARKEGGISYYSDAMEVVTLPIKTFDETFDETFK